MQLKNLNFALRTFAKNVITSSKKNLTRQKKNNGALYRSLEYILLEEKGVRFRLEFLMTDYGGYVDQGVRGAKSSSKNRTSKFKFGTGTGKKGGLRKGILSWIKKKRFQFQEKKSKKFMSYESMSFIIARSIYNKGIKPSLFFTKPFEKAFQNISEQIKKQFALDVQTLLPDKIK